MRSAEMKPFENLMLSTWNLHTCYNRGLKLPTQQILLNSTLCVLFKKLKTHTFVLFIQPLYMPIFNSYDPEKNRLNSEPEQKMENVI